MVQTSRDTFWASSRMTLIINSVYYLEVRFLAESGHVDKQPDLPYTFIQIKGLFRFYLVIDDAISLMQLIILALSRDSTLLRIPVFTGMTSLATNNAAVYSGAAQRRTR
jgi:hypothetical protein